MHDDNVLKREQKERHVKQSERKLMPGCTVLFYLDPPQGKMTAKYISPVIRSGKVDKKGWSEVIWRDGDAKTHAELVDERRLKSDKIADLKPGQWAILDAVHEEKVCANALLATDDLSFGELMI